MSRQNIRSGDGDDDAAMCVRALLQKHKVPERQHAQMVAELLGVTPTHARRKLLGTTPWTLPEIKVVAAKFGATLSQVLMPILLEGAERALLVVDDLRIECDAVMGRKLTPPYENQQFVAVGGPGRWLIVPSHGISLTAHEVCRLMLCDLEPPQPPAAPSV